MKNQSQLNKTDFDVLEMIQFIAKRWLMLAVLLIAGGLAGLALTTLRPPVYEASAAFGLTIDYTQTGALSDAQEDQAMRAVGSLLLLDPVIEQTLARLKSEGHLIITESEFRDNAFIDRGDFRWTIRYQATNPSASFFVVNQWKAAAEESFILSLSHAQTAESYLQMLADLQGCFQSALLDPAGEERCGFNSTKSILEEITLLSEKIQQEKRGSAGLFHALSINLVKSPDLPVNPVRHQRGMMVFSGALIGILIGIACRLVLFFRGG